LSLISFDLDGTIMRGAFPRGVMPRVLAHFARHLDGLAWTREQIRERFWSENNRIHGERIRAGDLVGAYDWDDIWPQSCASLGWPSPPPLAALIAETAPLPGVCAPLAGALQALEALRGAGHRVIALTNGHVKHQEPALTATGLLALLDAVVTPDRAGSAKPRPEIFWFAAQEPGVHVGDTLAHDVLGANAAGWASIWLDPRLPESIAALLPTARPEHPDFARHLEMRLAAEPWTRAHPEAVPEAVRPWAVIARLEELPDLLADGRQRPAD
jgi:FMN phosphatase YigB (HAD superfamily)